MTFGLKSKEKKNPILKGFTVERQQEVVFEGGKV